MIKVSNWIIMASIVCLLRSNRSIVRMRCSDDASSRCALGAFLDDPFFRLHRGHQLGLDAAIELGTVFFRDVGRRPDDVLRQAKRIERGFG